MTDTKFRRWMPMQILPTNRPKPDTYAKIPEAAKKFDSKQVIESNVIVGTIYGARIKSENGNQVETIILPRERVFVKQGNAVYPGSILKNVLGLENSFISTSDEASYLSLENHINALIAQFISKGMNKNFARTIFSLCCGTLGRLDMVKFEHEITKFCTCNFKENSLVIILALAKHAEINVNSIANFLQ